MSTFKFNEPPAQQCEASNAQDNKLEQDQVSGAIKASSEQIPTLPSPPPLLHNGSLHSPNTVAAQAHPTIASTGLYSPSATSLKLRTEYIKEQDNCQATIVKSANNPTASEPPNSTVFNAGLPVRTSSIRSILGSRARRSDSLSPASAISSPGLGPLADMTPLPSPVSAWGTPGLGAGSIEDDFDAEATVAGQTRDSPPEPIAFTRMSPKKSRILDNLGQIYNANAAAHARNRSLSEYVPEGMQIPRSRNIVVSTSRAPPVGHTSFSPPDDEHMHREQYLAMQRSLAIAIPKPPTPPESNAGKDNDESESSSALSVALQNVVHPVYHAHMVQSGQLRRWYAIRELGRGTFSTVMLATDEEIGNLDSTYNHPGSEESVNPRSLVAIKICEQGPAGGADEKKIETSIKREMEIMRTINHPSLVHLLAVNTIERRTFLVLNYCPGGDLFELANSDLGILTPSLIRRMFAELVSAVRHLHEQYIVHRDIKLENVLVNLPVAAFHAIGDWQSYPRPVVTLTDLGLGRWIPRPPDSPLLDTRCGSEDYAAPEVLIGSEYDGRSTDSWALGVLLYALMEGRLPFDLVPGARRKSPTSHRIARCEWQWVKWADADGEWDPVKGEKLNGAREIVEGLIARTRSRWTLEKVQKTEWVARGIMVDGGLKRENYEYGRD